MADLPRITDEQLLDVRKLIKKRCCNYDQGKCLALDDGIVCACAQWYTGFIFQNRYGSLYSAHDINRAIERIYKAHNEEEAAKAHKEKRSPLLIRHFSVHNLRHTFCTRFCENESNLKVIPEIMGHADIETTMNIYAEATAQKKQESFARLEGKIKIS